MDKENKRLSWLKEAQLQEKKEIFDMHLPEGNKLKEVMDEISKENEEELIAFKREQEEERARKLKELEQQQKNVEKEMND